MLTVEYILDGSAAWTSEDENSSVDCVVKFVELDEEVAFTATPNDAHSHTVEIFEAIKSGEAGAIKSYQQWISEQETASAARQEQYKEELKQEILELNPSLVFPNDADLDGDGNVSVDELKTVLRMLKNKKREAEELAISQKYGV